MQRFTATMIRLRGYAGMRWYPLLVGALAFADLFVSVIPTDIFVVSAVIAKPRRWLFVALFTALCSAAGCLAAAALCAHFGEPALVRYFPGLVGSPAWTFTDTYMTKYGLWALIAFSAGPLPLQPAVLIAGLTKQNLGLVFAGALIGRLLKYPLECWIAARCPQYLEKLFFLTHKEAEITPIPPKSTDSQAL